jgi:hypothetical protein
MYKEKSMEIILGTTILIALALVVSRLMPRPHHQPLLTRNTIVAALLRLGEEAAQEGETLTIVVVGGTALMLGYNARNSTRDVDAFLVTPPERAQTRQWVAQVAADLNLPPDWLNDGAKGFMQGVAYGPLLLHRRGIMVYQVAPEQLLAMKLTAWRFEQDWQDAAIVLQSLRTTYDQQALWDALQAYLTPFDALKARYAFEELWENTDADTL